MFADVKKKEFFDILEKAKASLAQLVELLICNQMVGGSSPSGGSIIWIETKFVIYI